MKVKDVMTPKVITCRPDDPISTVTRLVREYNISGVPVVEGEKIVGIVTEKDILDLLKTPERSMELWLPSPLEVIEIPIREMINWEETWRALKEIGERPVRKIMKKPVYTASPDDSIEKAAGLMIKHGINRLPVVEKGKLIGIVAREDIIRGLAAPI